jgi:DNA-directed RNA polymerase delta subunit
MKKRILFIRNLLYLSAVICAFPAFSQEKTPTLMILPSDNWCNQRYFMTEYNNQGSVMKVPDYRLAFQEDTELGQVIGKIGALMLKKDYRLKDAEQEIKNLQQRAAEDNVTQSAASGSDLAESPLDMLKRRAKADIIIQIWWKVNKAGAGKSVSFTLEAFDAYTSKRIASSAGTDLPTAESLVPLMLEKAVSDRMKEFTGQLDKFYKDLSKNGREIILTVKRWENAAFTLEDEIDGEEITTHINDWMHKNTVADQFSMSDATENFIRFEQVRIPLEDKNGRAIDAREFTRGLQKHLGKAPFNITAKLMTRGLGEAILVLGEK